MVLGAVASASSYAAMYRYSAFVMIVLLVVYVIFMKVQARKAKSLARYAAGTTI
jgi:Ca2+/H+ antiporter